MSQLRKYDTLYIYKSQVPEKYGFWQKKRTTRGHNIYKDTMSPQSFNIKFNAIEIPTQKSKPYALSHAIR